MSEYKHLFRVAALIVAAGIGVIVMKWILKPSDHGLHGAYRWSALDEIKASEVVNQRAETCAECHADIVTTHDKDVHLKVPCLTCHGDGSVHVAWFTQGGDTAARPDSAVMPRKFTLEGCLFCHRKVRARPGDFPQIDLEEHYAFLNVRDTSVACIACHSPHEPLYLRTDGRSARIHPVIRHCVECHDEKPDTDHKTIPNHPVIFVCKDCHRPIVEDFEKRPHFPKLDCSICHQFHKENDNAGRIYKNGNVLFCLMCHRQEAFKDPSMPPKIEWPLHFKNVGTGYNADRKACIDCHWSQVHRMSGTRGGLEPR